MQIGGISLAGGAAFAPMAGVSDLAMRRLCARYGAAFTVSEMVSAKAVTMKDKNTRKLYAGGGGEAPFGVQLFGYEPEVMGQAVQMLEGEPFDFVDINMGCPAPKIVGHGAGSALLKDPPLAEEMARAAVKAGSRPVTVKLRIGWDGNTLTGLDIARRCEAAGVSLLTVHGRTQAQMYAPGVDFEAVAQIKRAVSIPVLYNGDVTSGASALEALQKTGCDGVMVGRGAMGAPWVFAEIKAALQGRPLPAPLTLRQRFALLDEQIRGMCEDKGEAVALRQGRGVAIAYMRGLKGAAALRRQAGALTHYTDLARLIESAYEYNS
ncbi:MAG: tRNA dihydrouridine synthase DusB [Oscillospiraceae bacterium]